MKQWGCLQIVLTLGCIAAVGAGLGWLLSHYLVSKNPASTIAAVAAIFTFCTYSFVIDRINMREIRRFCDRHGLKVLAIKMHKNHYGVEYVENDQKLYGKWPKDFLKYENKQP